MATKRKHYEKSFTLKFKSDDELGRGRFAIVYKGEHNGNEVAIKKIPLNWMGINIEREVASHRKIVHDNVLKLIDVCEDEHDKYIVLELCTSSLDRIFLPDTDPKKYTGEMPEDEDVLYQIASGLEYIHSEKLVHRDIQPSNILISTRESGTVELKLSDFGLSKPVNERGTFQVSGIQGSVYWMAPEILEETNKINDWSNDNSKLRGTTKSDIFSSGCVFFFYLTKGVHPFGAPYFIAANVLLDKPTNFEQLSENHFAAKLIENMIAHDPRKRMTSEDLVKKLENIEKEENGRNQSTKVSVSDLFE